jgi:segregation and condensation protein B
VHTDTEDEILVNDDEPIEAPAEQETSAAPEDGVEIDEAEELRRSAEAITPVVEALLFVASEPLENKRLAKLTNADEKAVALAVQALEERYVDRGIVLREVAGGYRFATAPLAREAVEAYLLPPKTTLSTPALEALAIVAHMQPVTKSEIEAIRGVNSDSVVSTLLERSLIEEAGRKDVVGRPMQYKTSSLFLESFGLNSLDDLPQLELEPGAPLELNLLLPPGERSESGAENETAADTIDGEEPAGEAAEESVESPEPPVEA